MCDPATAGMVLASLKLLWDAYVLLRKYRRKPSSGATGSDSGVASKPAPSDANSNQTESPEDSAQL